MDRWVIYTHKHFRPLLCIRISLYLCWNLCDLSFGATLSLRTTNVACWQNWTFWSLNRSMRETSGKSTHLKIEQMVRKKTHKPQFRLRMTTVSHVPTSLWKTIRLLQVKKISLSFICMLFLGTARSDVRGTVETAKPVLRIWAQRPQSGHAVLQQRSVFDLFLLFSSIWLCSCWIFGVRNDVRLAWED